GENQYGSHPGACRNQYEEHEAQQQSRQCQLIGQIEYWRPGWGNCRHGLSSLRKRSCQKIVAVGPQYFDPDDVSGVEFLAFHANRGVDRGGLRRAGGQMWFCYSRVGPMDDAAHPGANLFLPPFEGDLLLRRHQTTPPLLLALLAQVAFQPSRRRARL